MSIQNFNTFQNISDTNLAKETQKYVIEALANLGQRYSMKGDGFSTRTSTMYDLIENFNNYDAESYICEVNYSEDHKFVEFKLVDKNLVPVQNINVEKLQVSNIISKIRSNMTETDKPIEFGMIEAGEGYDLEDPSDTSSAFDSYDEPTYPITMNLGIDETDLSRAKNVFMYANTTSFVFSLEEEIELENGVDSRFICEKYNKYSNKLDSAIRIFKNNVKDTYDHTLLYMIANGDDTYKLFVYHMAFDKIDELKDNGIRTISRHLQKKYNSNKQELTDTSNEDISFSPESFVTDLYTRCTKVNDLTTVFSKEPLSYNVTFDGTNYLLHLNKDEKNTEVSDNEDKYKKIVQYFAYDKTYLYRQIKTSYSEMMFKGEPDNSSYKHIVLEAIKDLFLHTYEAGLPLYIPLTYQFEYVYNTNDPWQVYFSSSDIPLRDVLVMKNNLAYTVFSYQDNTGLLRVSDKANAVEKTTFYRFNVEYDPNNTSTIYGISVSKHFTMPYINQFGYWVIDDMDTEVYARGRDAGNPNIIIVETVKGKDSPTILTMSNKEYFESLNWVTKKAKIELPKRIGRDSDTMTYDLAIPANSIISDQYLIKEVDGSNEYFYCEYLVPTLNNTSKKRLEENIDKLQYSIILNIAHVDSVFGYDDNSIENKDWKKSIDNIYGEDGRIMTFWVLKELKDEKCGYGFDPIETKSDTAVDINYMSNFVNTIGWVLSNYAPTDPDNFTFTQLVFDRADAQLMNNADNLQRVYPVIKNESLRTADVNHENTGFNNFNLQIQYNDTIEASYYPNAYENDYLNAGKSYINGIKKITQSETRYYDDWKNLTNTTKVSNAIYGYEYNSSKMFIEYVPGALNKSIPTLDLSEILVRDINTVNKTNILSFDSNAGAYYSYIGSDYTMDDKSILKIGTGTQNINLGDRTLVSSKSEELFNKQRQINIEFDNTRISTYAYIGNDLITEHDQITYGTTWRRYDIGGTTYWSTTFRQCGKFFNDYFKGCRAGVNREDNNISCFDPLNDGMKTTLYTSYFAYSYAFIALTVPEQYKTTITNSTMTSEQLPFDMYISDMVWIPGLMHTLCPQLDGHMFSIAIESDNDVIYDTSNGVASYIGVRLNSSMLNDLYIYSENDSATQITTYISDNINSKNFVSNELDISYFEKNDKYYFTINDNSNSNFMTYLHKIKQQY